MKDRETQPLRRPVVYLPYQYLPSGWTSWTQAQMYEYHQRPEIITQLRISGWTDAEIRAAQGASSGRVWGHL